MPFYRVTIALTVDIDRPDRKSAVEGAEEIVRELRGVLFDDEKVIKSSAMVHKRRVNGELNDEGDS